MSGHREISLEITGIGSYIVKCISHLQYGSRNSANGTKTHPIDENRGRASKRGIYRDGGHLSRTSGIEQLAGYMYFGMLYRRSPETIADYVPEGIPERVDRIMRRVAWEAIVESPYAGIDDENQDGLAD